MATLPNMLPQVEEQAYDTNQLGVGPNAYPYIGREPNYGMLLRNAALKESLRGEPGSYSTRKNTNGNMKQSN